MASRNEQEITTDCDGNQPPRVITHGRITPHAHPGFKAAPSLPQPPVVTRE